MKLLNELIENARQQNQFRPGMGGPLSFFDPRGRFSLKLNGYWAPLPVRDVRNDASFADLQRHLVLTIHIQEVPAGTPPREAAQKSSAIFSQLKGFNAWKEVLADKPERFVEKTSYLRVDPNTLAEQTPTLAYLLHVVFKTTYVLVVLRADPEEQGALEATIKEAARGLQEGVAGMPAGGIGVPLAPSAPVGFPPQVPPVPQAPGGVGGAPYPPQGGVAPVPPLPPGPPFPGQPLAQGGMVPPPYGAPPGGPIPPAPGVPGGPYGQGQAPSYGGPYPGAIPSAPLPTPGVPVFPGAPLSPPTSYPQGQQGQPQQTPLAAPAADADAIVVSFPPLSASFSLPPHWQLLWQEPDRARLDSESAPGVLLVQAGVYPDLASLEAAILHLCAERRLQVSPTEAFREEAAGPQGTPVVASYQGQDSQGRLVAIRYRALRTGQGTAIGVLGVAEPGQIEHLLPHLEALARTFRLTRLVMNQALSGRLVGTWSQAPQLPGTLTQGAAYTFEANGTYRFRGQQAAPAGGAGSEEGRYFVSQGALVLSSTQRGSRVVPLRLKDNRLHLHGEVFTRVGG